MGEDGKRYQLWQDFPVTFYAAGENTCLRALWKWLEAQSVHVKLERAQRRDLFSGEITVLSIQVRDPIKQPWLFAEINRVFPQLTYFDADISIFLRHAARYHTFPFASCRIQMDENHKVYDLVVLNSPWHNDQELPPIRMVAFEPDADPAHAFPSKIITRTANSQTAMPLEPARALIVHINSILSKYDPDLILTAHGDTWLFQHLLKLAKKVNIPLNLNRDPDSPTVYKSERSYFAYGQVIYRGGQIHLKGRLHLDITNTVMYHDYGLEGVWELARITSLPVQTAARVSPGTGISSMQIVNALKSEILIPWRKQQAEYPKSILELVRSDMGGLVFQPTIGLHKDVAEIDFVSMYPTIMERFNISPETIIPGITDPKTGLPCTKMNTGLIPQTLKPLLEKRIGLKAELASMSKWDYRYATYKARSSAHKWLLVTCFGYLGYKNARFGRIEAHEAVTAYGREALLRAKEAAEDLGFEVLHLYVDGMWVKKKGCREVKDFQPLLDKILADTNLPISLDGIYRWIAFLPSRRDSRVPVANRYFGVFQNGEIKTRGIELRRHDTPHFISETQHEILNLFASSLDISASLIKAYSLVRQRILDLNKYRIALEKLLVTQTLSRTLDEYQANSPLRIAVGQLQTVNKFIRPGQRVRFLYTRGSPGVHAWDLPTVPAPNCINALEYQKLLFRAVETVLTPFDVSIDKIRQHVFGNAVQLLLGV